MKLIADTRRLVKLNTEENYLITVYINTRWADEKQRERVKIFFRNELKKISDESCGKTSSHIVMNSSSPAKPVTGCGLDLMVNGDHVNIL